MKIESDDSDELIRKLEIRVDGKQEPIRIDKFLMDRTEKMSRNRIQNGISAGAVTVNGKNVKSNYRIRPHDEIQLLIPKNPSMETHMLPEDIPLEVVYEDAELMIVNKPAGMVVHPGIGNHSGTMVNALLHHLGKDSDLPLKEGNRMDRPGIVHRIDKDTSGLLVVAKTDYAMTHLAKQFFDHTVEREYHAIVWGTPEPQDGTVEVNIGRHPRFRMMQHVFPEGEAGKHAITHYRTLMSYFYVSKIACNLETGRTHQIRVHLKSIGHPLFNDVKYGGDSIRKGTVYAKYKQFVHNCFQICQRQALHAAVLGFEHPTTGERIRFESPLPEDMSAVLDKWEHYHQHQSNKTL